MDGLEITQFNTGSRYWISIKDPISGQTVEGNCGYADRVPILKQELIETLTKAVGKPLNTDRNLVIDECIAMVKRHEGEDLTTSQIVRDLQTLKE